MTQIKIFNSYIPNYEYEANEFIKKVDVVDVKMNTVFHEPSNNFFTQLMVVYRNQEETNV